MEGRRKKMEARRKKIRNLGRGWGFKYFFRRAAADGVVPRNLTEPRDPPLESHDISQPAGPQSSDRGRGGGLDWAQLLDTPEYTGTSLSADCLHWAHHGQVRTIGPGMGPRMALTGCLPMRIVAMVRGRMGTHSLRRATVAPRNSLDRETTPWSCSCQSAMGSLRGSKQQGITRDSEGEQHGTQS